MVTDGTIMIKRIVKDTSCVTSGTLQVDSTYPGSRIEEAGDTFMLVIYKFAGIDACVLE